MRLFLDTNILIDFYAQRAPFTSLVCKLIAMEMFGDAELWVSAKSFTDIFYVMSKHKESHLIQEAFRESFRWLQICSIDTQDIAEATKRQWHDFEDCLVALGAEKVKADYLITRDKTGFAHSVVKVLSPQEFLDYCENELDLVYDVVD